MAQWVLNAEGADIQRMRLFVTGQQSALLRKRLASITLGGDT